MKMGRYLADVALTYLTIQITGLAVGSVVLGLERRDRGDGMVIGFMVTVIPTIIYSIMYAAATRLVSKHSSSLPTHILIALALTILVYAGHGTFFIKDTLSLTSPITWQTLISCFIAGSCGAVVVWLRTRKRRHKAGQRAENEAVGSSQTGSPTGLQYGRRGRAHRLSWRPSPCTHA